MGSPIDNLGVACYMKIVLWFFKAGSDKSNNQKSSSDVPKEIDKRN